MIKASKSIFTGISLDVEVSTNAPDGGDGSCTIITLRNAGGFCFNKSLTKITDNSITISCQGDFEYNALIEALDFASLMLKSMHTSNSQKG